MSFYTLLIFAVLLLFLLRPSTTQTPPRNHQNPQLRRQQQHRSCDSLSRPRQRSLCFRLQRIHNRQPFPAPPQGIDPRYDAEKRLVPSDPNPLHN
ncbi:hypothetical protein V6N12_046777 [Hibiscus sabdariffa]|uniref:CLAVATA3/ESR (CLE)-related protein 9 n=1 Tax=Hibiscus sabdariffa TaxID=183260 RepID=A0ABR2A433_9ROSI